MRLGLLELGYLRKVAAHPDGIAMSRILPRHEQAWRDRRIILAMVTEGLLEQPREGRLLITTEGQATLTERDRIAQLVEGRPTNDTGRCEFG